MPASYVEILSKEWISKNDSLKAIIEVCETGKLYLSHFRYDVIIKTNLENENRLNFELQDESNLQEYYNIYPTAIDEPKEFNPFFYIEKGTGITYKSIALANHYLDDFINWEFSRLYLKENQNHIISFNRDVFICYLDILKVEYSTGFIENWAYKIKQSET